MTDRRRELEIVQDVAALIRRRPEMFFGGEANGEACLEMLRERAHWLGVGELAAEQVGPWIVVRSSRDWFSPGVSEQEHVTRLMPLPAVGQYAFRAESIVAAVSRSTATRLGDGPWHVLTGSGQLDELGCIPASSEGRAFAFIPLKRDFD